MRFRLEIVSCDSHNWANSILNGLFSTRNSNKSILYTLRFHSDTAYRTQEYNSTVHRVYTSQDTTRIQEYNSTVHTVYTYQDTTRIQPTGHRNIILLYIGCTHLNIPLGYRYPIRPSSQYTPSCSIPWYTPLDSTRIQLYNPLLLEFCNPWNITGIQSFNPSLL